MANTRQFLDFEKPVVELEEEILKVRALVESGDIGRAKEAKKLETKLEKARKDVYGRLTPYQRVQLARISERIQTEDIINKLITDFVELHGDRAFGDDAAIIGGVGKFEGNSVVVIGHQRGRTTQEKIKRNFGMPQPEGYRKAQRLFKMAEKFNLPLLMFIDTQGAYPGLEAEERGQAEAIARCLLMLSNLRTRIISTVIGEGGSGGALALGICDRMLMLENSVYSVISPEGCASIIWGKDDPSKTAEYAKVAAQALKITAPEITQMGLVDEIIKEPAGAAHRDRDKACELLGQALLKQLKQLNKLTMDEILAKRYEKFRKIGQGAD
ncbi:MAG: acetyl-CoA carboxylase carboxyltransferase subunit alpha [Deltaproteobacteria bacterium]|nr:acetyl-CoA carboxylase carboxyltransferase subunit alpha [Deltaproteobacteria bacterium]